MRGGSARGCLRLGDAYHDRLARADGAGAASGADEAALYWHARACHAGANLGCLAAGRAYLHGQGASADPGRAAALFQRVCERGNAHACVELGHLHAEGEGVQRDDRKAVELFTKACKLGLDEGACGRAGPATSSRRATDAPSTAARRRQSVRRRWAMSSAAVIIAAS